MGSASSDRATEGRRSGVALQPVIDLIDGVDLGYEALPRPAGAAAGDVVSASLALAQHTGPAVMLVPLTHEVLNAREFSVAATTRRLGLNPSEVAWIVRTETDIALDELALMRLHELRTLGFLLAVDGVVSPTRDAHLIAELRADFVFLDPALPARLVESEVARADLAAAVVFVARLGGRIVARGIDSKAVASVVAEVGVQYGVGPHLARPLVFDPAHAESTDEVVPVAWFQRREVRVFHERGDTLRAPIELITMPESGGAGLDDRSFARFLVEAARALQAEHDPERILYAAADRLAQVIPADRLALFEADWERHRFRARVLAGKGTEGLTENDVSLSEGITGWSFARGQPYRCADTDSHPAASTIPGTQREPESMLAIPLIAGDQRLGMLDVWRDGLDAFSEQDLERAALLGFITAAAWSNAQMYGELERRALTDALTGLFNIRWWRDMGPRVMAQSIRTGAGVGILLMDLDHFKQINDSAGHAAGDSVLRAVARALRRVVRDSDYAVRYGGEEFLIVLTNSNVDGAMRVAQALQAAMAELRAPTSEMKRVTASIGVAVFPDHGQQLDDVVAAADLAMYQAKRDGRDRIAIAPIH
ncbi:MAG TPA: diguanylate cyclase [Candidatus Acidoferrales bacterium]|nr:diguanylate cyclase [Candidatus Acidoferrales bacterium]